MQMIGQITKARDKNKLIINDKIKIYQIRQQILNMSYYDPLYPSIEATRNEIQRSILALQDKLRLVPGQQFQRRQIDLDIQYSRNQQIARRAYDDQLYYREALANSDRMYANAYQRAVAEKFKYAQQQQSQNLRHLSKIQQLERQRLQLSLERQRMNSMMGKNAGYIDNRTPFKNISGGAYDQDQTLLKKYQDGTRARQYIDEIDSYGNSRQKYSSATKNSKGGIASQFDRSPYNNLKYDSERKGFGNQQYRNGNPLTNDKIIGNSGQRERNMRRQQYQVKQPRFGEKNEFSHNKNKAQLRGILKNNQTEDFQRKKEKNPQNQDQYKKDSISGSKPYKSFLQRDGNQQTFGFIDSSKKSVTPTKGNISSRGRSKSHKQLNSSKKITGQSDYSPYLSYLDPNVERSPSKSKRSGAKKSALQRSRNLGPPQANAMQRIKNRLKVSEIVYKDSKFKNVKHQLSHLFNTYDCQSKLRREIKEKINSHPTVLKKHAMVVD